MKRLFVALSVILLAAEFCAASPVPVGGKVEKLAFDVWYQNKSVPLKDWLGKKIIAVLFVTTAEPDPGTLRTVEKMAVRLKKDNVGIFLVANGLPKNAANVPGWKNLKLPVAFDLKSGLFKQLGGDFARVPFWAVITEKQELAWRGEVNLLPALIRELKSGRYKVADAARREAFTQKLTPLMKNKKYLEAVNLISQEQKFDPANAELLGLKCNLLWRRLKQPKAALAEVEKAINAAPGEFHLYDFKLRLQRQAMPELPEMPVFRQMAERFAGKPAVLMGEVKKEMARSLDAMNPEGVYLLAGTAAAAKKFSTRSEEGLAHLSYARILHYCGRPDLAVPEAEKAEKLLTGRQKKMAEAVRKHFEKIRDISRKIK